MDEEVRTEILHLLPQDIEEEQKLRQRDTLEPGCPRTMRVRTSEVKGIVHKRNIAPHVVAHEFVHGPEAKAPSCPPHTSHSTYTKAMA